MQDLYFEVCREKTHVFIDAKDSAQVKDLKRMLQEILKVPVTSQTLFKMEENGTKTLLEDDVVLSAAGFNNINARAQTPAVLGLQIQGDQYLQINDLSVPPPIPDAMRTEQSD